MSFRAMESQKRFINHSSFEVCRKLERIWLSPPFKTRKSALKWAHLSGTLPVGTGENWISHEQNIKWCQCDKCNYERTEKLNGVFD